MTLLSLIIILIAVAFLLRIEFVYYIVYVCIGVYLLSRLLVPRVMRGLLADRHFTDHAFSGETVDVTLSVDNTGRLPLPWLEMTESIPPELRLGSPLAWAVGLPGRAKRRLRYQVQAGRRGYYLLGPARLTSGDLFGLSPATTAYLSPNHLTVYPSIIPLVDLGLPSRLPFGGIANRQRLFEDPSRPAGVREYRSGDTQRQINWKASAHADQLLVRRFQPAISLETALLLNLHEGDYDPRDWRYYTEWAITVAASLAVHLANLRQPIGLLTNGIDPLLESQAKELTFDEESGRLLRPGLPLPSASSAMPSGLRPHNGRAHLMKILEVLARIESDSTLPLTSWAATACAPLSWGVTILAITAQGDQETCQALHRLVRAGFNPILIAVEPNLQFGQVRQRARQLGFSAFHAPPSTRLDVWRLRQGAPDL